MGIYVEIQIRWPIEDLWEKTQNPQIHQRWDLRFSEIEYLQLEPGKPQTFTYKTRIGAGLCIAGRGESTGERDSASGERTSALKFWSDERVSLIRTGSGYWKYLPAKDHVTFLTWYDYQTRWGIFGYAIDRSFFRPLMGWATAWSFDRLRLWIEEGVPPEVSLRAGAAYLVCRLTVALVWAYHGLIPKLIFRSADEINMMSAISGANNLGMKITAAGSAELAMACVVILFWRAKWPLWLTVLGMVAATVSVAAFSPQFLSSAFNAVTLNSAVTTLCAVALLMHGFSPTASRCLRRPRSPA